MDTYNPEINQHLNPKMKKSQIEESAETEDKHNEERQKNIQKEEIKEKETIGENIQSIENDYTDNQIQDKNENQKPTHLEQEPPKKSRKKKLLKIAVISIIGVMILGMLTVSFIAKSIYSFLSENTLEDELICNVPYIQFEDDCCLDLDNDRICDGGSNLDTTTTTQLQTTTSLAQTTTLQKTTTTILVSTTTTIKLNTCSYPDKIIPQNAFTMCLAEDYGENYIGYSFKYRAISKDDNGCIEKVYLYMMKPGGAQDTSLELLWNKDGHYKDANVDVGLLSASEEKINIWVKLPCQINTDVPDDATVALLEKNNGETVESLRIKLLEVLYNGECPESIKLEVKAPSETKIIVPSFKVSPKIADKQIGVAMIHDSETAKIWVK